MSRRHDRYLQTRDETISRARAWAKANPERYRANMRRAHLMRNYGLTVEAYDALVARQKGRCAICRKKPAGKTPKSATLHVDHCHASGEVRGLLCGPCNRAIGILGDTAKKLKAVLKYLTGV